MAGALFFKASSCYDEYLSEGHDHSIVIKKYVPSLHDGYIPDNEDTPNPAGFPSEWMKTSSNPLGYDFLRWCKYEPFDMKGMTIQRLWSTMKECALRRFK
ncbi:hypothetical protein CCACVL1_09318 [Corchorus capsularis]|uniref:Uncharacterized protein n=1 Tax=Corchorus capsularis TaxID=210143 RepID=A0A1R3IWQ5_COCAP|nr:hypothetical protein CCACVL1_09318 [Corchorus capsularis]